MREVDDCPGRARRTSEDGEHNEPGEEKDKDVGRPHPGIREPLGVFIQIRRRRRPHIQIRHPIQPKHANQMLEKLKDPTIEAVGW